MKISFQFISRTQLSTFFFDDGLYAFNMVENEIFKIQAVEISSNELENFENIFNELIQNMKIFYCLITQKKIKNINPLSLLKTLNFKN